VKRAESLEEAARRLQALINVLDEDLRVPSPPIPPPERIRRLTGTAAAEARSALRFLERSVEEMERYVAEARRLPTSKAQRDLHLYEDEVAAACDLLRQCRAAEIDWTKR